MAAQPDRKTALVTGGAGFIGSHLVDRLVDDGWAVSVIDNLLTGKRANVNERAAFYELDLASAELAGVFEQGHPSVVFHLAAQASVARSMEDPAGDARTNVTGTLNLLRACAHSPVERVVFMSTGGALYGDPEQLPCTEDHPVDPLSVYGASKYAAETYLRVFARDGSFSYAILRPGNVFGPRQDPFGEAGVIAIFVERMLNDNPVTIFGDGTQERDYVFVRDVVEANVLAATLPGADGPHTFNIGTGVGTSVLRVFELIAEATGYRRAPTHAPPRPGEVRRIYLDSTRAQRELGWSPGISLEQGISRTLKALRAPRGPSSGSPYA